MPECTYCNKTKDQELFVKCTISKSGYRRMCKDCNNSYYAKRRIEKYEQVRAYEKKFHRERALRYNFGLSEEDYQQKLKAQCNTCAICNKSETENKQRLAVDHCHSTGIVRGLLCSQCNLALGLFTDSLEKLQSAKAYLEKYK